MGELPVQIPSGLRPDYLQVLSETATLLLADSEPQAVCELLFRKLSNVLQLDAYFHYLVSDEGTHLELASCAGVPESEMPRLIRLEFGQAVCGTVAKNCQWMYVPGVQARNDEMTGLIRGYGIRCYTCQPLISDGTLLGTFSFGTKQRDTYAEEELELIRLVCQQVAIAVARRETSKRMRQLEKLAVAGRLSAAVAHEINNPLESITNLLFLLRDEVKTETGGQFLKMAETELDRLSNVARQTLGFFRERRSPEPFEIDPVVSGVVERTKLGKNVDVQLELTAGAWVTAVRGEIEQVVCNLLINAAQFSPIDAGIRVCTNSVTKTVLLSVEDEGPGVPEDARPYLFQPFFSKRSGGSGLGLWLSREIARNAGGDLFYEKKINGGNGARFVMEVPRAQRGMVVSA